MNRETRSEQEIRGALDDARQVLTEAGQFAAARGHLPDYLYDHAQQWLNNSGYLAAALVAAQAENERIARRLAEHAELADRFEMQRDAAEVALSNETRRANDRKAERDAARSALAAVETRIEAAASEIGWLERSVMAAADHLNPIRRRELISQFTRVRAALAAPTPQPED